MIDVCFFVTCDARRDVASSKCFKDQQTNGLCRSWRSSGTRRRRNPNTGKPNMTANKQSMSNMRS